MIRRSRAQFASLLCAERGRCVCLAYCRHLRLLPAPPPRRPARGGGAGGGKGGGEGEGPEREAAEYRRGGGSEGQREAAEQAEAAAKAKAQRVLWQVVITSGPRVCVKGM